MADQPVAVNIPASSADNWSRLRVPARPRVPWQLLPLVFILLAIIIGPQLLPSATTQSLSDRLTQPFTSSTNLLGTDGLGRDLLARILVGARNSLGISVIAASGASIIGIAAGIVAGVAGGWIDRVITLLVESVLAVPFITVGLMVTATIGQSSLALILILIATGWITHARVLRTQSQVLSSAEFVRASHSMGGSGAHVMWHHIVPNIMPTAIVVYFQQVGSMLLWSASLTWLGIGTPIETISLGGIVRDGQELLYNGWWVSVFAGLAIVLIVTSLNLAADWLRISLDPHTKGQSTS